MSDTLGREFYEHGARAGRGYRGGYRLGRLKSAKGGAITFAVPQMADRTEPFCPKIREVISGRSEELERLAIERYARGLSTRGIEAGFRDESWQTLAVADGRVPGAVMKLMFAALLRASES